MIDWLSAKSELLLNRRAPSEAIAHCQSLYRAAPELPAHLWLTTSGSTSEPKLVGISKEAFLVSARAVNTHLQSTARDRWLLVLPTFHVGGLGILARAFVSGARVVSFEGKWDARRFVHAVEENAITLSSLVPTQLYDIVQQKLASPSSLRALVIGGGAVDSKLYARARSLGWNLLPSYGLTECASQVATASLESSGEGLQLLPHIKARVIDQRLSLQSESLFSGYLVEASNGSPQFVDPKAEGWFLSEDEGTVEGRILTFHRRTGERVKVGGELVDIAALNRMLRDIMIEGDIAGDAEIVAMSDERLGYALQLLVAEMATDAVAELEQRFNEKVLPYERIRKIEVHQKLIRSALGKFQRSVCSSAPFRST